MRVIGLRYGTTNATDFEAKKRSRDKTRELIEVFERVYGTTLFNEISLNGVDFPWHLSKKVKNWADDR